MLVHGRCVCSRCVCSTMPCLFNALIRLLYSSVLLKVWEDVCQKDACHEDVCHMMRRSGESLREIGGPEKHVTESRNKRDRNAHHLIPPLPFPGTSLPLSPLLPFLALLPLSMSVRVLSRWACMCVWVCGCRCRMTAIKLGGKTRRRSHECATKPHSEQLPRATSGRT